MNSLIGFQKTYKTLNNFVRIIFRPFEMSSGGEPGSGSGKGGGSGGSIRDAGGSFGKREAALEEEYFRKLTQRQLKELKEHLEVEVDTHSQEIAKHEESIKRHQKKIEEIKNLVKQKD